MTDAVNARAHDEHPIAHIMPLPVLLGVFAALMVLTFLTVAATWVNMGWFNLPIAMAIATVKATLVALYFMHLRYDAPFNGLALLVALVFVGLFIAITLLDTIQYQPDVERYRDKTGASASSPARSRVSRSFSGVTIGGTMPRKGVGREEPVADSISIRPRCSDRGET